MGPNSADMISISRSIFYIQFWSHLIVSQHRKTLSCLVKLQLYHANETRSKHLVIMSFLIGSVINFLSFTHIGI